MIRAEFDREVTRLFHGWLHDHRLQRPKGHPRLYERQDMLAAYRAGAASVAELALAVLNQEEGQPHG